MPRLEIQAMKLHYGRLTALVFYLVIIAALMVVSFATAIGNALPIWIADHPLLRFALPFVHLIFIPAIVWLLIQEFAKKKRHELSEDLLSYVLRHLPAVIWIERSRDRKVMYLSPSFERVYGMSAAEALRSSAKWLERVHPEDRERLEEAIQSGRAGTEFHEYRIIKPERSVAWIRSRMLPVTDDDGKIHRYVGFAEDVTERKAAEQQIDNHRQRLQDADKLISLGILVSGVAHEINNPNHTMLSNATIISESWRDILPILDDYFEDNGDFSVAGMGYEELKGIMPHHFKNMIDASRKIETIVNGLRNYARQDVYDFDDNLDINAVVAEAISHCQSLIRRSTNYFSTQLSPSPPMVHGNFQRLEQVIISLIQNACQSLKKPDDGICVTTGVDGTSVAISVTDQGKGVPQSEILHITDPFYTTNRENGARGLGLSVSTAIVDEHQGRMMVESDEETGTSVTVYLPLPGDPDR